MKDRLQAAENWILTNPSPPENWPWTWLYKTGRTAYALGRDLVSGHLALHAMSLVYTTLLSIVPLLALSFSVLKALGVHQRMEPMLYQFFQPMGPQGVQLAEQICGQYESGGARVGGPRAAGVHRDFPGAENRTLIQHDLAGAGYALHGAAFQ
jgi:hypothetical protein